MANNIDFVQLVSTSDLRGVALALVELERGRGAVSMSALSEEPFSTLETHLELTIEIDSSIPDGCPVYGCYRPIPPTIIVHPSMTFERDKFTLLHEYGHHVQRQHSAWANVWLALPDAHGRKVNEAVADHFAAEVLMPEHKVPFSRGRLRAKVIRDAYAQVGASRQALTMRAVELASADDRATIALIDEWGTVRFARSTYDEIVPLRRGGEQPGLAHLFEMATERGGHASGPLPNGAQSANGWARQGLTAEVAIDSTGRYGFAVIRREGRYGELGWERAEHECLSEACGEVFVLNESITTCRNCHDPKCPECGTCSCEETADEVCEKCFTVLTPAERSGIIAHECF